MEVFNHIPTHGASYHMNSRCRSHTVLRSTRSRITVIISGPFVSWVPIIIMPIWWIAIVYIDDISVVGGFGFLLGPRGRGSAGRGTPASLGIKGIHVDHLKMDVNLIDTMFLLNTWLGAS